MAARAVAISALLVGLSLSASPANAACAPDPASSGQTVTCSGNTPAGFQAGGGIDNLTLNVLPGATVSDGGGGVIIGVNDFNTVTNSGTLSAGPNSTGIFSGVNNTIVNAASGVITVGDNGSGIFTAGNSTVTNAGAITAGDAAGLAAAIVAINDDNTVSNLAGATITAGQADGILMQGNRAIANNAGTINMGSSGAAIDVFGNDAMITSNGVINGADNAAGIAVQGDRALISHFGTINGGVGTAGVAYNGSSGTINNSGGILLGDDAVGIVVLGDSNTITNSGVVTVGTGFAVGIDVSSFGGSNAVINTGTINVGAGGTGIGILLQGTGTVFNSGTINAAGGFAAIEFCGCGIANVLTLGPGSVINGLVFGTGIDTFQLGGLGKDTFNLGLIGAGRQYDGFSTFNKVGSSNWTVTGTGAQDWNILGGTLSVNGTINGLVTVIAGGTLGGIGTIDNVFINGGVLAPGNSIGTLNVAGSLTFSAASSYMVEISGAGSDLTRVTGVATLGGATVVVVPSGPVARQYTILNATGGIPDTFNPVVTGVSSNLNPTLSYDANNVYLNFALNFGGGLNVNQQNVANALTNFFNTTGSIPAGFASLSPAGLTQVSGELATGSQQATFDAMNLFLSLMSDPFVSGRSGGLGNADAIPFAEESALGYAAKKRRVSHDAFAKLPTKAEIARNDLFDQRWNVWGAAFGGGSSTSGNAALGSNDATARVFGFAVGADYRLSRDTLAGFALAGGGTNFSVSGFGSGRSDLFQAGAFIRHNIGNAYVTAAAAYGWQDVTTERTITAGGFERLRAQFNANAYSGRIEGGTRYLTPWMGITPYAAGQFTTYSLPAYAEQVLAGAGTFALNYAARDVTAARSELGVRSDKSFAVLNGLLTLRGRAAWAHDFNTDRNVTALFQTLPGAAFAVNGAAQAHDSALVTAAAEMKWLSGWSATTIFEGQFSNVTNSYAGKGVVRYAW